MTELPKLKPTQHGWAWRIEPIQETKWLDKAQAEEVIRRCEQYEKMKRQLELGYENFKVWYDMNKRKHSLCMGEPQKQEFFEILQALKEKP